MNKMMTSVLAFGAGMAAYNLVQRNNLLSDRQMKQMQKKIKRTLL
ncbi:MAG TPA: YrzQ family protein [Bacillales bacterium]|nr:YrzQ family protein [Bacillales bacterium]HJV31718.1 YrzQ family protein [Bacillales bacterium]